MKTKTLTILIGILLSFIILSCREESLPQIPYPDIDIITNAKISSKSDSTNSGKELENDQNDPPKDRDNWKMTE